MNAPAPVDVQADALVEGIRHQVAERRAALLDAAAAEAAVIRRRARDKARRQMQRAIDEMRLAGQQRLQQLRAELETGRRRRASLEAADALALAWPLLTEALHRRWSDASARRSWIASALALARRRWPRGGWVVRHPASWGDEAGSVAAVPPPTSAAVHQAPIEAVTQALTEALTEALVATRGDLQAAGVNLVADPALQAGLVIEADGARLDATPAALLADRSRVEAAVLAAVLATIEKVR